MRKAIFIDKDGTLIRNVPYNVDPAKIVLEDNVGEALRLLKEAGYALVVITNQAGVARGYFPESAIQPVVDQLNSLLAAYAVQLDGFFYCPHHPEGTITQYAVTCSCRKPSPGLILEAARQMDISLAESWMLGDILHDVEAGNRSGCRSILIDNGNETEWETSLIREPVYVAGNMLEAAEFIIHSMKKNRSYGAYISDTDKKFH